MRTRPKLLTASGAAAGLMICGSSVASSTDPSVPAFAPSDQLTFIQNFSQMTSDSQLGITSGSTITSGDTWFPHYPGGDNADFIPPEGHDIPFGIDGTGAGSNYLTIRAASQGTVENNFTGTYTEGALSSMDHNGNGFSQEYGYFEVSMWVPHVSGATNNDAPNSWPSFWLDSAKNGTEIDATESYGNWGTGPNQSPAGNPNYTQFGVHDWSKGTGTGSYVNEPDMTSGFHLYGVDVEPTGVNFYYDRQLIWSTPFIADDATPFYILLDNALGGGNYNNATGTGYNWDLTAADSDLQVQYVAAWASPYSPNFVATPEPSSFCLLLIGYPLLTRRRRPAA
jgi:hypothetical protein